MTMIPVLNRTTLSTIVKCIRASMCTYCDPLIILLCQYRLIESYLLTTQ